MKTASFLCIFLLAGFAQAQEIIPPTLTQSQQYRFDLVQKQDELLDLLLQVPFEQRQYIFPMLSSNKSVPKKIKTHPEVLVWKGKRPTKIADIFKDDEELIQYLPEQFYYFLSPEMWEPETYPDAEFNPNQILQNMMNNQVDAESLAMPVELIDIYTGLDLLQKKVQQQKKQPEFPLYFKSWINTFSKENKDEIKKQTSLEALDFGEKVDKIAQTYRLYQKQKTPPSSDEQKLVQEYWSLIPFIFQKTGFKDALNAKLYQD